jgi:hypothetical protein
MGASAANHAAIQRQRHEGASSYGVAGRTRGAKFVFTPCVVQIGFTVALHSPAATPVGVRMLSGGSACTM